MKPHKYNLTTLSCDTPKKISNNGEKETKRMQKLMSFTVLLKTGTGNITKGVNKLTIISQSLTNICVQFVAND